MPRTGIEAASVPPVSVPPVSVALRIAAPAEDIFRILADPTRHLELDGSEMLRGAASDAVISGVGEVFTMRMYFVEHGDYEMDNHVVEFVANRRIGWEPAAGRGHPERSSGNADQDPPADRWGHRWSFDLAPDGPDATIVTEIYDCSRVATAERQAMDDGQIWMGAMRRTLERLAELAVAPSADQAPL